MGVARADSTGAGGETSKSESTSKGLTETKREGVIGGGSRRRVCCVCGLGMLAGREKICQGTFCSHSSHIIRHYPTFDDIGSQLITFRMTLDNICPTFSLQHFSTFFSTFSSHLLTFFNIE